jgi:hypothetical protein
VEGQDLVVVGNPGIGKSVLSFLFIRTLLELGVSVCFPFHLPYPFFAQEIYHFSPLHRLMFELENGRITITQKNEIEGESNLLWKEGEVISSYTNLWDPSDNFVPDSLKQTLRSLERQMPQIWVVVDEYVFVWMLVLIVLYLA